MYQGFWDFLFDEKLRETREILSKKRSNAEPGKKEKSLKNVVFSRLFGGGEEGIRSRLRARSGVVKHCRPVRIPQ